MSTLFITRPDLPASQELLTARRQGGRLVGTLKRGHSTICTFVISPSQERCIARGERIAIRDTDVISIARGTRVLEAEQLSHAPRKVFYMPTEADFANAKWGLSPRRRSR